MRRTQPPHRKRGVTASRSKLTHALTEAGLRTQAALAERIADIEGLDSPPKDAVNRAFRELPVDPQTVERIARALRVDAFTLYKTAEEQEPLPTDVDAPHNETRRYLALGAATALAAVVVAAAVWIYSRPDVATPSVAANDSVAVTPLDLGSATLVVMPFDGDTNDVLAHAVRSLLGDSFRVATDTATVIAAPGDPVATAETLRADAVLDGEIVTVGRIAGLRFYLTSSGLRRQIWAETMPAVSLPDKVEKVSQRVARAVRYATGLPVDDGPFPYFPLAPVQADYLEGAMHLDAPANELNVKRAETRFEAALRQDANYALAHAGLCEALLQEHWMSDEERALKDAGRACGRALQLDPNHPVVAAAHAHFLRLTGRIDDAIAMYLEIVEQHPRNASALAALADTYLHRYRQSGDDSDLQLAVSAADASAAADPLIWKPLFALARMHWFAGDVDAAIVASERALARDENEYVAANLGSFLLCAGRFDEAIDAYTLARDLSPHSYVGDEFLGQAHYFLGNFDESARLRRRAIESIGTGEPEIHEMWGNLGDSYRQLGRREDAIDAYVRAAEIAERDHLRGTAPAADRAARAYYYTMLNRLDDKRVPASIEAAIAADLEAIDAELVSATAHRRMAQLWLAHEKPDRARLSLAKATSTCVGYGRIPDLSALAGEVSASGGS